MPLGLQHGTNCKGTGCIADLYTCVIIAVLYINAASVGNLSCKMYIGVILAIVACFHQCGVTASQAIIKFQCLHNLLTHRLVPTVQAHVQTFMPGVLQTDEHPQVINEYLLI